MDLKSLLIVTVCLYSLSTVSLILIWLQYRKRYAGLMLFWLHSALCLVGTLSLALRPFMNELFSIFLSNITLLIAMVFLLIAFGHFFGSKPVCLVNYFLIPVFLTAILFFSTKVPNIHYRQALVSTFFVIVISQIIWLQDRQTVILPRAKVAFLQVALVIMSVVHAIRAFVYATSSLKIQDYYQNPDIEGIFLLSQLLSYIVFAFALLNLVTQRLQTEIESEEAKFNTIFTHATHASLLTRMCDSTITDVNSSFLTLTGYKRDSIVGRRASDIGLWVDANLRSQILDQLSEDHPIDCLEIKIRRYRGQIIPCMLSAKVIWINGQRYMLSTLNDISDVVELRGKLEKLASHDPLTHLPNRNLFEDRFTVARAQAVRSGSKFALAIFDIDDFKKVNDQYGHTFGDKMLIAVSERATHYLRLSDTVARFGGDEFVILLSNVQNRASAADTLGRIVALYHEPFHIQGETLESHISMGAALYPDDGDSLSVLLHKADDALYQVKRAEKNNLQFFREHS